MKITRDFIFKNTTKKGAWNKAQLSVLGIDWPPKHGWIVKLEGQELSDADAEKFKELAKLEKPQKKIISSASGNLFSAVNIQKVEQAQKENAKYCILRLEEGLLRKLQKMAIAQKITVEELIRNFTL